MEEWLRKRILLERAIHAHAEGDATFRCALLENPAEAIETLTGKTLPETLKIETYEDERKRLYISVLVRGSGE